MPLNRLSSREIFKNTDIHYDEQFKKRDISGINQFDTAVIEFPANQILAGLSYDTRIWQVGDRLHKIAHEVFGDSRYWWVVAQFNKKPTDHHFQVGDIYYVPLNLEDVLNSFGY